MFGELGRVVSFETCCQWALLSGQLTTILFKITEQKYMYPSASKVDAGLFVFP